MRQMLYILAEDLAQNSGLDPVACRGLLRLAIEDISGTRDTRSLSSYMAKMGFDEWNNVLEHAPLAQRLRVTGAQNAVEALQKTKETLIQKQALFTMTARYR